MEGTPAVQRSAGAKYSTFSSRIGQFLHLNKFFAEDIHFGIFCIAGESCCSLTTCMILLSYEITLKYCKVALEA
jgi:hypothetical protein